MKKIFYDLETSGLDKNKCSIIQLSGYVEIDGEVQDFFDFKMRPWDGSDFEPKALELYENRGISMDEILLYSNPKIVFKKFQELLCKYVNKYDKKDKFYLYGYNNRGFDDDFLRNYFTKMNDPYFGSFFHQNTIDIMVLASEYLLEVRPNMPNFKLQTVAEVLQLDVQPEMLHDAEYDVKLTRLAYNIFKSNPDFKKYIETMQNLSVEMDYNYHPFFGWDYYEKPSNLPIEEKVKICLEKLSSKEPIQETVETLQCDKLTDELPF
jgi:DNA polymerase-3 subunit epsilon